MYVNKSHVYRHENKPTKPLPVNKDEITFSIYFSHRIECDNLLSFLVVGLDGNWTFSQDDNKNCSTNWITAHDTHSHSTNPHIQKWDWVNYSTCSLNQYLQIRYEENEIALLWFPHI